MMERFPDPQSLVKDLHQTGFKAIWMLDPGIKYEEGYFVYDSGSERDVWIQTADGRPFVGICLSFVRSVTIEDTPMLKLVKIMK
ncbi:unnamed protein product [Ilex paraguariensis]|uniref:Glycoside hydrolase family 31 TIM barrel domain-containing protein n=1 Tax=Ilex paraguariensis TaxID=185542 RepID=A0ABC8T4Z4_9AQUA